ncbi:MAG: hypothetical protein RI575_04945 [Balneolaceae bacterium]|nr:hypothetical protein [Balneolaceae bacterium]MDR9407279.1 hypothetical protein [Balneolaceae bacterium]
MDPQAEDYGATEQDTVLVTLPKTFGTETVGAIIVLALIVL